MTSTVLVRVPSAAATADAATAGPFPRKERTQRTSTFGRRAGAASAAGAVASAFRRPSLLNSVWNQRKYQPAAKPTIRRGSTETSGFRKIAASAVPFASAYSRQVTPQTNPITAPRAGPRVTAPRIATTCSVVILSPP